MPPVRALFYLATAGGMALLAKSLLHEPPPLWVALAALASYVGLVTLGVVFSRFSMFADVITSGPKNARGVALTFDDGPDPRSTPAILDLLEAAGAKATFFVIGKKVEQHPELVRAMSDRGHAVGLHSHSHERLMSLRSPRWVKGDLERVQDVVHRETGHRPVMFRAPIGHISPSMGRVIRQMGLVAIGWSARAVDGWSGAKPDDVAARVAAKLADGVIVLLHDAAEKGDFIPASVAALPQILEAAKRKNLTFVRVDAWLGIAGSEAEAEAHDAA